MTIAVSPLSVATCRHQDVGMADWQRLGEHVIARRTALGYKTRAQLAEASGISVRILGDIETGRRGRFDPKTLAALENALGWTVGSANRVATGGEPSLTAAGTPAGAAAIIKVMKSGLSADRQRLLVQLLLEEKEEAERRVERAQQLLRLVGDDE